MKRALKQNKSWGYAEGILKDWAKHNLRTLTDVEAYEKAFQRKNKRQGTVKKKGVSEDVLAKYGHLF